MSDDVEKFVLSYVVNVNDGIGRLSKLQEKMDGVHAKSKSAASGLKDFASGASNELGKLIPGMDAVANAVRGMGAEIGVATAALAAMAIGVKAVIDLRNQMNQQRSVGMRVGLGSLQIENYERQAVRLGGGYVNRDSALEGLNKFSELSQAQAANVTPGHEWLKLSALGVTPNLYGHKPVPLHDQLVQLANGLQGKSAAEVQGIAQGAGLDQNWLMTIQKIGPQMMQMTDMTNAEVDAQRKAKDSLGKLNDELGKFNENINEIEQNLGQTFLPALEKITGLLAKATGGAKDAAHPQGANPAGHFGPGHTWIPNPDYVPDGQKSGNGHFGPGHTWIADPDPAYEAQHAAALKKQQEEAAKQLAARNKEAEKEGQTNAEGVVAANAFRQAVNMFNTAVQSFSGAIDDQQALAAWAGEMGKQSGVAGSSNDRNAPAGGPLGPSKYDDAFAAAAMRWKVPVDDLKRIATIESHMDPYAVSSTGATGIMQITKGNQKAFGLTNPNDPAANIMVGAQIYSQMLARYHGDRDAALRGYNGNSDANYVAKFNAVQIPGAIGQGRSSIGYQLAMENVAKFLHVPVGQLMTGGVTKGDMSWAIDQQEAGIRNNIVSLTRQLNTAGMPQQNYAKLQNEIRQQAIGLQFMQQHSAEMVSKAQDGGRQLTLGERSIYSPITINGVTDPKAVAAEVNRQLGGHIHDAINQLSDGTAG